MTSVPGGEVAHKRTRHPPGWLGPRLDHEVTRSRGSGAQRHGCAPGLPKPGYLQGRYLLPLSRTREGPTAHERGTGHLPVRGCPVVPDLYPEPASLVAA